jgi:hypothetical protein
MGLPPAVLTVPALDFIVGRGRDIDKEIKMD